MPGPIEGPVKYDIAIETRENPTDTKSPEKTETDAHATL